MKVYRSKIGWEIWIPALMIVWSTAFPILQAKPKYGVIVPALITIALIFVILSTRYIITENTLRIRCTFIIDIKLDIRNINRIRKTFNPISSPAAAVIGRIEIFTKDGSSVIISPVKKEEFLTELLAVNSNIDTKDAL